jgi:uncharacterized integral membrane protein (TIGR00698 family)
VAPGLGVAILIALAARIAAGFLPSIVAEVTVAILFGAIVAALAGERIRQLDPGLRFAAQRILRLGIVLLGARLSLGEIARIGLPATGLILVTMTTSLAVVLVVARLARVEGRLALLIAVGSAVCGNTAIVATAPVIGARPREVAYAIATITLFGTLAVFLYPAIGRAFTVEPSTFGLWSGVAVHDTSQVIATGAAFGSDALDVATVVKLIRNALMAPLLLVIAAIWSARANRGDETGNDAVEEPSRSTEAVRRGALRAVPLFVFGFLALAGLRTVGVIGADAATSFDTAARVCILVALSAVGLSIRFSELRAISWRPLAVGFTVALTVGLTSLAAISALGLGDAIGH